MEHESLKFPRQPDKLRVARASRPLSRGHTGVGAVREPPLRRRERDAPATAGETPALHRQGG